MNKATVLLSTLVETICSLNRNRRGQDRGRILRYMIDHHREECLNYGTLRACFTVDYARTITREFFKHDDAEAVLELAIEFDELLSRTFPSEAEHD